MKKKLFLFLMMIPFVLISCNKPVSIPNVQPSMDINDFAFVINGADISNILNTSFDLAIIDYSQDGTESGKYTTAQIQSLKGNNTVPIAYLSIGEAEDYRYYWQSSWETTQPSWLGDENPNWEGNYKVRYWEQDWQDIIFDYLDKIIEQEFSGLMLDIVDAYYYWSVEVGEVDEAYAAGEMINFIYEIANYAKSETGNPDFIILPQNAVEILDYDLEGKYINNITGLSIESLFYKPNGKETNKSGREYRIDYLRRYKDLGKVILNTDYVYPDTALAATFYSKAQALGFLPYAADRSAKLDEVILINNLQPVD